MRFKKYGTKLANSEEAKREYKKSLDIRKRVEEISDIELQMWYEDSVFKKVSGIEYSRHIAITKYELFLTKDEKYISDIPGKKKVQKLKETPKDDDSDDNTNDSKPLFTVKLKK